MKRHLAPALLSLSLCAVMGGVGTAGAQTLDGTASVVIDSTVVSPTAPVAVRERATEMHVPASSAAPMILAPTSIRLGAVAIGEDRMAIAPAAVMVDWKMPTSRALIIGGTATALVGVLAVKGDTGAIIGLAGTAVAVYGLYLHYTR